MTTHHHWRPRANLEVVVESVSFVDLCTIIPTEGDSVQLMWIESRLKERLNFERCTDLGVDDGDRMVTILNRLVTWSNQMGMEVNPRHREVVLARMSMDGFHICTVLGFVCEMQTHQEI